MRAGRLQDRIALERKITFGTGGRGETTFEWHLAIDNVPAEVVTLQERKLELNRQLVSTATHKVTIRALQDYSADDVTFMRVKWGDVYLYPGSVIEDDGLVLICTREKDV